jgi:DNA topoisomerase-1
VRLLSLPRDLGAHPDSGEEIVATTGRFGPYIKCGKDTRSVRGGDDVYTITRERALELLAQPKVGRGAKKVIATLGKDDADNPVEVCEGRYGPYITNGEKNAKIPKDTEPEKVTLEQAKEALAAAPAKKGRRKASAKAKKKTKSKAKTKAKKKAKTKTKSKVKASANSNSNSNSSSASDAPRSSASATRPPAS